MRIMNILHDSVVDGEGLRTVIFFAGCPHHCHGCHNPESWNQRNGKEMTKEEVLKEVISNPLTDVTFSGGEPFQQAKEAAELAVEIKKHHKNIWIYSGYTLEEIVQHPDPHYQKLLSFCDVLVDGKFEIERRNLDLEFRGSTNQRIIHL